MRTVRLGDLIAEARPGFASGDRATDGLAQVRMNNVTTHGGWDWSRIVRLPVQPSTVAPFLLRSGDVLFNNTNSTELVGKSALFTTFSEPLVFSNHFTRLRTSEELDPAFLAFWLLAQWQAGTFARLCDRWVGQSAIRSDKLLALLISVPPVREQRIAAGKLTAQLAAADRAREGARRRAATVDALRSAIYREAFSRAALSSTPTPLGDVVDAIRGVGFSAADVESQPGEGLISVLTTGSVQREIDWRSARYVPIRYVPREDQMLREGDVLVSTANSKPLVGKAAIVRHLPGPATFGAFVTVIRARVGAIPEYVAMWMQTANYLANARERASQTTSIANLRVSDLLAMTIPLQSIADQERFVRKLESSLAVVDHMNSRARGALEATEALPAALLRQALLLDARNRQVQNQPMTK